jgi:hypothetical protein
VHGVFDVADAQAAFFAAAQAFAEGFQATGVGQQGAGFGEEGLAIAGKPAPTGLLIIERIHP